MTLRQFLLAIVLSLAGWSAILCVITLNYWFFFTMLLLLGIWLIGIEEIDD